MNFAWYGHLKFHQVALWKIILISWLIAFFEYILLIPANRLGAKVYTGFQLKIIQEVITLVVFSGIGIFYLGEQLKWNHVVAMILIILACFFVVHKWD
jgi:uncharacterized protein (DUF486 family)